LVLQPDLFYQGEHMQSLDHLFQLLNVNLPYHRRDASEEKHAQQLVEHHLDPLQPELTLKHLLAVTAIGDLNVAIIYCLINIS
jgi:hypothetical protein